MVVCHSLCERYFIYVNLYLHNYQIVEVWDALEDGEGGYVSSGCGGG